MGLEGGSRLKVASEYLDWSDLMLSLPIAAILRSERDNSHMLM